MKSNFTNDANLSKTRKSVSSNQTNKMVNKQRNKNLYKSLKETSYLSKASLLSRASRKSKMSNDNSQYEFHDANSHISESSNDDSFDSYNTDQNE